MGAGEVVEYSMSRYQQDLICIHWKKKNIR
jgi:hypothetical protein